MKTWLIEPLNENQELNYVEYKKCSRKEIEAHIKRMRTLLQEALPFADIEVRASTEAPYNDTVYATEVK